MPRVDKKLAVAIANLQLYATFSIVPRYNQLTMYIFIDLLRIRSISSVQALPATLEQWPDHFLSRASTA